MRSRSTLYIVGDSTLCSFEDKDYFIPRSGYGTKIHKYTDFDNLEIVNLALSGRSSKSFINEENYPPLGQYFTNIGGSDGLDRGIF